MNSVLYIQQKARLVYFTFKKPQCIGLISFKKLNLTEDSSDLMQHVKKTV